MPKHGDVRWECERTPLTDKNKRIIDNDEGLDLLEQVAAHFPNKGLALAYAKKHCLADCFGTVMIYRQHWDTGYYEPGVGGWETAAERIEVSANSATNTADVYEYTS